MTMEEGGRPRLLSGVRTKYDGVRGNWVLLAPERAIRLDGIGAAILAETDGERTLGGILDALAARYDAPREQIAGDVVTFLASLRDRRMLEVT